MLVTDQRVMVTKSTKIKARPDPAMDVEGSDEEPDFSDPEDFVDDINDEELLAVSTQYYPRSPQILIKQLIEKHSRGNI